MIDQGFNRLSTFNKDDLPTWFLDDEAKFYKPNIPITKEAINALREKQRALDARPIKKVAEAKARKKFKAHQRLEKAKKKADGVMDTEDLNEAEKARQVGKVMGKAGGKPKLPDKKIVIARGANKGVKGRPKGVTGRYKIVDARMRKEVSTVVDLKIRLGVLSFCKVLIPDPCASQDQEGRQEEGALGGSTSRVIVPALLAISPVMTYQRLLYICNVVLS